MGRRKGGGKQGKLSAESRAWFAAVNGGNVERVVECIVAHGGTASCIEPCSKCTTTSTAAAAAAAAATTTTTITTDSSAVVAAFVDTCDGGGATAVHKAARAGHGAIVRACVHSGATVDARDNTYKTAMHEATCHGHLGVVRMLLAHGARLNPHKINNWVSE